MTTNSIQESTVTARPGSRSAGFASAVEEKKLKTGSSSRDATARGLGLAAMVVGVVAAFVVFQISRGASDSRDIASFQILALACLGVCVLGVGLYVAGALSQLMRLWLLRQVIESQERHEELLAALREKRS
jgi:hypothetical protein